MARAAMIVDDRHAEMQLDIGHIEIGPRLQESAAFGEVRGHRPIPLLSILTDAADQPRNALQRRAVEKGSVRSVAEDEIRMVLQIGADAGQMMDAGDAVLRERVAVA